jgi:gamma-glutamyltranspeptidase/glutathione hydrolase
VAAKASPQSPAAAAGPGPQGVRAYPYAGIGMGDRITGPKFVGRSTVWGANGAAATAHPTRHPDRASTSLRRGGSAIDAAIAINAALGFLEPTWPTASAATPSACCGTRPSARSSGFNGSGNSPRGLSLAAARGKAGANGLLPRYGAVTANVPGAVDAWWAAHQRYGKLPWAEVLAPVIELCERGEAVPQLIAWYLERNMAVFDRATGIIEENENRRRVFAPGGRTPRVGEVFANPDLARTYRLIAEGGRDAFYDGPIADAIEGYFRRIGGWMTRADLAAHRTEWVEPLMSTYRGVEVYQLGPNTQGLSTLQLLNVCEQFDLRALGFQSAASIHVQAEAKRLAFEDRARWFADPEFSRAPVERLISKAYARRARRPDPHGPADGPHPARRRAEPGRHHLFQRRRR